MSIRRCAELSWFPVDDAFHSHPKARKAGLEAIGLWTLAGSHCMAYLTDGFVADWWVKEKPKGVSLAKRLVAADLWNPGTKDGEQGFWFHDWKPECLKVNVLAAREKARLRKARSRESQRESRVTDDETPASCLVPTQPNPTQPIIPVVISGGGVALVDDPEPPRYCNDHPNDTADYCRPCIVLRKGHDAWKGRQQQREDDEVDRQRQKRQREAQVLKACRECDEDGWRYDDREIKCNHQEAAHG